MFVRTVPLALSYLFALILGGLALLLTSGLTHAESDTPLGSFSSSAKQATLVELFTSQGCYSCPPADAWLSTWREDERLWSTVVPVAYHVTYWNYLGWRDPFSAAAYDQRQRNMARRVGTGVYTPGVFANGSEFRSWRRGVAPNRVATGGDVGVLKLNLVRQNNDEVELQATFTPAAAADKPLVLEWAWLRTTQHTPVSRGENAGKRLQHDFVAAAPGQLRLEPVARDGGATWAGSVNLGSVALEDFAAFAGWVRDRSGAQKVVQATGGWLAPR